MSNNIVYVVAKDGYNGYGMEIYLLGVFTDKDRAEKIAKENQANILGIQMNEEFPLKKNYDGHLENDYFIGGYIE